MIKLHSILAFHELEISIDTTNCIKYEIVRNIYDNNSKQIIEQHKQIISTKIEQHYSMNDIG